MYDPGLRDYPDPPNYEVPHCPVCGQECETLYRDRYGEVIGCNDCIDAVDAWEVLDDV